MRLMNSVPCFLIQFLKKKKKEKEKKQTVISSSVFLQPGKECAPQILCLNKDMRCCKQTKVNSEKKISFLSVGQNTYIF